MAVLAWVQLARRSDITQVFQTEGIEYRELAT